MCIATCPSDLIIILRRWTHSAATQLRVNPLCGPSFLRSASGVWGDFLGADSCAPIASHSPWGCIYLSLVSCAWFSPGHGPLMGRICPSVSHHVAWILHESGLPPIGTRTHDLEATFLCYCSELSRSKASSGCRPLHSLSYLWASGGNTIDISAWLCLLLATPYLGDASLGRCLCFAMPFSGDVFAWRCLSRPMSDRLIFHYLTCW